MVKNLIIYPTKDGFEAMINEQRYRCAVGKNGLISQADKNEGDGCTPIGIFPLRRLFYRPDRYTNDQIKTELNVFLIEKYHGWCDDPRHSSYNRLIDLRVWNKSVRHETLWRDDHVYNLIIDVGYNDDPILLGKGSAIFIHLAKEDYTGTEGCIACNEKDLISIISHLSPSSVIEIKKDGKTLDSTHI
ncbi:MAG: L,D-transpeptidase family protein [Alphaproteobacteria bacterium]|nr:L,D-transpeptidase family protein [Alphaproteobacteria bacterium]